MSEAEQTLDADPIAVGELIDGKYLVESVLGQGSMGVVVKARHQIVLAEKAIKFLLPTAASIPGISERFRQEARASAKIGHPAFVAVDDFGVHRGRPYMVMELLVGRSLFDQVMEKGALPLPRAVHLLGQAADGLHAAHEKNIIHRDVKPQNLFIVDGDFLKIFDLGIAKFLEDLGGNAKTKTGAVMGTPITMAPEQITQRTPVDRRTDIYALSIVAYFAITGTYPFDGEIWFDVANQQVNTEPPQLKLQFPWVPAAFSDLIRRGMAKDPNERPATMAIFAAELRQVLQLLLNPAATLVPTETTQPVPAPAAALGVAATVVPKPASGPLPVAPVIGHTSPTPPIDGDAQAALAPARKASRARAFTLAIAGLGVLAAVAIVSQNRLKHPRPAVAEQTAKANEAAASPSEESKVVLFIEPHDATVRANGELQKTWPVLLTGKAGRVVEVEVERDGYEKMSESIRIGAEEREEHRKLQPRVAAASERAPATEHAALPEEHTPVAAHAGSAEPAPSTAHDAPAVPASGAEHPTAERASPVKPPMNGTLAVSVLPWAEVIVDGKAVGSTPIRALSLKPGVHKVEITQPQQGKHETVMATIKSGHKQTIKFDWSN